MNRVFLSWTTPLLQTAVDWLVSQPKYYRHGILDLQPVTLALPTSLAGNRIAEILVDTVQRRGLDPAWFPPRIMTFGQLPETFYVQKKPIAPPLVLQFAWVTAIDEMWQNEPDIFARFLTQPPEPDEHEQRMALGKMLSNIHNELAAESLSFEDVAEKCRGRGVSMEHDRWRTLARLQKIQLRILHELNFWDVQSARMVALEKEGIDSELAAKGDVVLIGTVDMNRIQKDILESVSEKVTALVFAPENLADRFDKYGCLIPEMWTQTDIPFHDTEEYTQIQVVSDPDAEAAAVVEWIRKLDGLFSAAQLTIGIPHGNSVLVPFLEKRLAEHGVNCRYSSGHPINSTAMYQCLVELIQLVDTRSFSALANLMRLPRVKNTLQTETTDSLSFLDKFHKDHLPQTVDDMTSRQPDTLPADVKHVLQTVQTLTTEKKSFSYWIPVILEVVRSLLFRQQDDTLRETNKLYRLLEECGEKLTDLPAAISPMVSSKEAMRFLLHLLGSETIVEPSQPDTMAMYGWLELPLDDAAATIVTGMVDGAIPSSQSADMFLPNSLRQELGIEDNDRRFARDAYAMSVLLATHPDPTRLHFTFPQRDLEDAPQLPSRLFFAADGDTIARRVKKLFGEVDEPTTQSHFSPQRHSEHGEKETKTVVTGTPLRPLPPFPTVESMRVTEFKDYITCPYRYFLRHRLKLEVLNDKAEELNALAFGNLAHNVLQEFGNNKFLRQSTDVKEIAEWLTGEMWRQVMSQYGKFPRAIVAIQMEQLRQRLAAFAKWQASWTAQGNKIIHVEFQPPQPEKAVLWVNDTPPQSLRLRGRIDRIDYNEAEDSYYLLDYKTSNTAEKPEKTHRKSGRWVDFQLPLYRHLANQAILDWRDGDLYDTARIQCGYIVLPKDTEKTGLLVAKWSAEDLRSADEAAREVVRSIWNGVFWPPTSPPPPFSDDFAPICGDR